MSGLDRVTDPDNTEPGCSGDKSMLSDWITLACIKPGHAINRTTGKKLFA